MQSFTLRDVQTLAGVSRSMVNTMVASGIVTPARGPGNQYRFSFQDLLLFRTAQSLRAANVPTRRVVRSIKRLEALGTGRPLTGIRITALRGLVAVKDEHGQWHAETGQRIMDFETPDRSAPVLRLNPVSPVTVDLNGYDLFEIAQGLERDDPEEAERAYRKAIAADPGLVDAYVNLGCLLCDSSCYEDAVDLYRSALDRGVDGPLIRFNLAVALEDSGHVERALAEYHACIALAPDFADAHYNAARLHEAIGDHQRAIRHFHQYKRFEPLR
ncbi:tetratricopeptide repeat protein [Cupriavidus sp. UYPR2.512]|uniref:tetratricopeptide repeat protein n=1 Tax=Cupriavidus sp. UYPR2.512 TaxID=1080187 RepID=UPI00036EEA01|nr:tetratricopeptide repeat protein [Cupriavidus sp. UYPR2.512]UIF89755.1 tetratricopeptide repeat protein [Cupriavidus necator]